jgi:hypothetical protein
MLKGEGGLPESKAEKVEQIITSDLVQRGKEMLHKLIDRLGEIDRPGESAKDAIRIFRVIENISKHHRELISVMHGGNTFRSKEFGETDLSFGTNFGSGFAASMNQEENFGAQALKGLVEGLKKPKDPGSEIKSLTESLIMARDSFGKDSHIFKKIQARLDHILDERVIPLGTIDLPIEGGQDIPVEIADIPQEESDAE